MVIGLDRTKSLMYTSLGLTTWFKKRTQEILYNHIIIQYKQNIYYKKFILKFNKQNKTKKIILEE